MVVQCSGFLKWRMNSIEKEKVMRSILPRITCTILLILLTAFPFGCTFQPITNFPSTESSIPHGYGVIFGGYKQRGAGGMTGAASPKGTVNASRMGVKMIVSQNGRTILEEEIVEFKPFFKVMVPAGKVKFEIIQGDVLRFKETDFELFPYSPRIGGIADLGMSTMYYFFRGPHHFEAYVDVKSDTAVYVGEIVEKGLRAYPEREEMDPLKNDYTSVGIKVVDLMKWYEILDRGQGKWYSHSHSAYRAASTFKKFFGDDLRAPSSYSNTWQFGRKLYRKFFDECMASCNNFEKQILNFTPEWKP